MNIKNIHLKGGPLPGVFGDYAEGIDCYQKNLDFARKFGERSREAGALYNLGVVYYALGDYATAIDYHHQSLTIAESRQNLLEKGLALSGLGAVYAAVGNYDRAIEYLQQSLELARLIEDSQLEETNLSNLGLVYHAQKDYAQAIEFQQQSLALARQLQDLRGERKALGNLGQTYYSLTDYPKAIELQRQSLALARELEDRIGEGRALENLGLVHYALENYTEAIDCHRQSLALARQIRDRHAEGRALTNLGDALSQAGQPQEAIGTLRAAIEIWESLRSYLGSHDLLKVAMFETHETSYDTLYQILVEQNQLNTALEITERARARAFVDLLARKVSSDEIPPERVPPNLEQIQQISRTQNSTLVSYSIIERVVDAEGTRQSQDSELYIWVISPTGNIHFRQVDLKSLDTSLADLVASSRESIGIRGRGSFEFEPVERDGSFIRELVEGANQRQRLQQLYQLLIQPIADLLPTEPEERVVFIPQGPLFLAPFPALQDEKGKYLIEKHTILTAPAIEVLELTRQKKAKVRVAAVEDILVVGNPTMPTVTTQIGETPEPLNPLLGAEAEAVEIARQLQTKALINEQAKENAIVQQMPKAKIIHLATHGLLDDFTGQGVPGAIALAPSGTGELNDGLLTANEILDLDLNAELVVLSACDTGLGNITGDGVIGLSRSLFIAGTPSVIVSLWKVPDAATAFLMTEFYRNLQEQKLDKAQALRQAMLTTMKRYRNPIKWAAFTLIGEAE